jgi:hypothetical protein
MTRKLITHTWRACVIVKLHIARHHDDPPIEPYDPLGRASRLTRSSKRERLPLVRRRIPAAAQPQEQRGNASFSTLPAVIPIKSALCRCVSVPTPAGDWRAVLALIGLLPIFV